MTHISGYLELTGARMYYEVNGGGPPLVLMHAGIADRRMWAGQIGALSRHYTVITPDFRGYGSSVAQQSPFRYYEDICRLLQHLKIGKAALVGCSIGGLTALKLMIAHPEAVACAVLVAPGLSEYEYTDAGTLAKDAELSALAAAGKRDDVVRLLVDLWVVGLKRSRQAVSREAQELALRMIKENYDMVMDRLPETEPEFGIIPNLPKINAPVLVMIGSDDLPDMQAIAHLVARKIPGAREQLIPGAAHLPNLEREDLFNRTVLDFLGSVYKDAP
jgi:pimeloyl-ACP methyl ester carboxylesterase